MLRTLSRSMHRLSISTIDGFFNRVAQSFSHELDLPPEPVLVDESHPSVALLREQAIEAMLGEATDTDEDLQSLVTLLRQFHHDHAARSVTQALDDIITQTYEVYREAGDGAIWSRLDPPGLLGNDSLHDAVQALTDAEGELPGNKSWAKAFNANLIAARTGDWEGFIKSGLAAKVSNGENAYYKTPIEGALYRALATLVDHARSFLITRVAMQTRATHDLLSRFDKHYNELRRRRGVLLFSDLTHKLARELPALGDDVFEDVYYRLDGRVTHLLLDEFQDTSLAQWKVLSPIAQETRAVADGSRSLLVVGDAKQAIYGWRGGVAELFTELEQELMLVDVNLETLAESYRSSGVVLDAVNRVFASLENNAALEKDAETAGRWRDNFQTHRPKRDLPGHVTLETSIADPEPAGEDDGAGDDDGDTENAGLLTGGGHERYVAERVKELYEREGGAGSIGVLVGTNAAASRLIFEIGRLGLPVSGEGGGSVTDSPAVAAVLSALTMADHTGDTASVFHVLNSPLAEVVGLTSKEPAHVQRVAMVIRWTLLTRGYAQTLADWARAVGPSCDARGMTRLTQLIELADSFEPGDALRPSRFVALAESQRVAEPSPAAVRVMTVHGSKGLEFDTVVLAELDKRLSDRTSLLVERPTPTSDIVGVYRNPAKYVRDLDERLKLAGEAHRASRLMDDLCALYVAMTRARQALHMIVKPGKLTAKGSMGSRGLSYAAILCDALCDVEETVDGGQVLYEHGDPGWVCRNAKPQAAAGGEGKAIGAISLSDVQDVSRRFWPTVSPSSRAGGTRTAEALLDISTDSADGRHYGTLIHAWMEAVGFIDEDTPPTEAELRKIARRVMPGMDVGRLDERIGWFNRLLTEPTAQDVLSRQGAAECWRERSFAVYDSKALLRGCFDRVSVYRDDSGRATRAVLVDFKTDHVGEAGTVPLVSHYQPQIQAYRRAIGKLLGLDASKVIARLWFIGADIVADVPE
jgi:ATP-dependent exoDNAse (exonuclease V) beta subunit